MRSIGNVELVMAGVLNCPVQMMAAIDSHDRKGSRYHRHDDDTYGKITMPKVCDGCGATVSQADTVSGYEEAGGVVMLTADDLETIAANTGAAFDIPRFIRADEVNPMMFSGEKAYYLVPDPKRGKLALMTYKALIQTLTAQGLVGVVQYTRWGRNRIGLLRVEPTEYGGVLVVQNMIWPDELRAPAFPILSDAADTEVDPRLLPVMGQVVESMIEDWNPVDYVDTYTEKLNAAIEAKAAGKVIESVTEAGVPKTDDVGDLLAKLAATAAAKKAPAKKAPAKKAPAKKAPAKRGSRKVA